MAHFPGKVRLAFKDFPLPFHEGARPAAEAARCAGEQGHFWPFHDLLFLSSPSFDRSVGGPPTPCHDAKTVKVRQHRP